MSAETPTTVVLLPGAVKTAGRVGHHDYLGGCKLLADLLEQTQGVRAVVLPSGWPEDDRLLDSAQSLVFYTGGRRQPFLGQAGRSERMQEWVDRGGGLVMIHQAVRYPREFAPQAKSWLGGVHVVGEANRGHWRTQHRGVPTHPIGRGVDPWKIRDGWMREIEFVAGLDGVTPLVWSSRRHRGSPEGGIADVVSWAYDRPDGGRSFCYTGVDAHSAWSRAGLRQLVVNGILWSSGLEIPPNGGPCGIEKSALAGYLTPRDASSQGLVASVRRLLR